MSHIPDLVRDSRLETQFRPKYLRHRYHESDSTQGERVVVRQEYWKRERCIGGGSYGRVWLERCLKGEKDYSIRAVKEIQKPKQSAKASDYNRELEAIAKFSHERVRNVTTCVAISNYVVSMCDALSSPLVGTKMRTICTSRWSTCHWEIYPTICLSHHLCQRTKLKLLSTSFLRV